MLRPHLRFSIRSLLLLTVVAGLVFAESIRARKEYLREQAAIASVQSMGGKVELSWRGPLWLQWLPGHEQLHWYQRVTHAEIGTQLWFHFGQLNDEHVANLAEFHCLESAEIRSLGITDNALGKLAGLQNLRTLVIPGEFAPSQAAVQSLQARLPACRITRE